MVVAKSVTHYIWFSMTALMWVNDSFGLLHAVNRFFLRKSDTLKHILIWTAPVYDPMIYLGTDQETFLQRNCSINNCYVTGKENLYKNVTDYDMLIFHGPDLERKNNKLPTTRSQHQLYVYASMESPIRYPLCTERFNRLFNLTWTYKLNSDLLYVYLIIKDKKGNVIGPRKDISWEKVDSMDPIDETLKAKLDRKHRAAAWFVSNCQARNNRRQVASEIKEELEKYGFTLDVYGKCGWMSCEWDSTEECSKLVERHYYFYLAFENSFGEDYVSEKLLRPLKHYAVPVVYGGANYTRFMPDGIYLNARKLDIEDLVQKMVYLIRNKEEYYKYFRWHNHYSYHDPSEFPETDPYCNLCAAVNNKSLKYSDYQHFDIWWNEPYTICPKLDD